MLGHICRYPECRNVADASWRLTPVCKEHYDELHAEALRYYGGKIAADERESLRLLKLAVGGNP